MEKKMMILLRIKIYAFILLSWTYYFKNDISIFKMSEFDNYQIEKKIDASTYRILAKYKQDKDSCAVYLQEYIQKYGSSEKRYVSNNEEKNPETKKQSNGSASVNEGGHKQHVKNKSFMFETKAYSRIEKKIFKELDYLDFLQNNRTISDKFFRKIIFKKYKVRICLLLFIFFFLSFSIILDFSCGYGIIRGLLEILNTTLEKEWSKPLRAFLQKLNLDFLWYTSKVNVMKNGTSTPTPWTFITKPFLGYIIYFIPFLVLGITIILGIFYYHKKVKKYQEIKFKKR
ncbi:fam-l protein [Plasmodium malariae]|uniref:Fam-l protein n=1 Tax=Plasmodium malariae TaxID=5858 RepID=A0A1D3JIS0_PLAMA|nr:fam-l protein [Plasmodium malariae]SBT86392.1 fam-l protein [Plasmodium malariae]